MINRNQIVIFGAGKIGRSFIGQLFGRGGYELVFIDVDSVIINGLNQKGSYQVVIKDDREEEIIISNVRAISAIEKEKVVEAVSEAGILATSVGKNVLERIIPLIAGGLVLRNKNDKEMPLDIIIAENMRLAADFFRERLIENLPPRFPLLSFVGLIETSIGKMVPIIPQSELEKDPLIVFAESYNTLIVDQKGFKSAIPLINGLAPKTNIKAWVDRKSFIHNLGHATAAYYGYALYPEATYFYEVLDNKNVLLFTRSVMLQSAETVKTAYPEEFSDDDLEKHVDDLIRRFRNKALRDTVFRVGQDLVRKLGSDDRFMGAIHLAMKYQKPYDLILKAMSYGLKFMAKNEVGTRLHSDILFTGSLSRDVETALIEKLGYDRVRDLPLIERLIFFYEQIL